MTNRFELEAKVPYVYRSDTSVGREFLQGAATNSTVFDASGKGLGDIEVTGRYQLNNGGLDKPYYIGSLRLKTRTGTDPFDVLTAKTVVGFRNDGIQTELPTGSGFYGLQPALTVLYPSDPAVFFGTVSYLHTFSRSNVTRNTDVGSEFLGKVSPGGILGFNFGMGLGINDKSSFSIGYDHASVGKTRDQRAAERRRGAGAAGNAAARLFVPAEPEADAERVARRRPDSRYARRDAHGQDTDHLLSGRRQPCRQPLSRRAARAARRQRQRRRRAQAAP